MIQDIQILKDRIQIILNSKSDNLSSKSALDMIRESREKIFINYEAILSLYEKHEIPYLHKTKDLSLYIENKLKIEIGNLDYVSLNPLLYKDFSEIRNKLSEIQDLIRDTKSSLIFEFTKENAL